ncbi:immunity 49 family protein [Nocardia sp. NPDC055321]
MQSISRHEIDQDFCRSQVIAYQSMIISTLEDMGTCADALGSLRSETLDRLLYQLAVDSTAIDEQTWKAAVLASQAANAIFTASSMPEGTVQYTIEQPRQILAAGVNRLSTPTAWIGAAWLAILTGSEQRIQEVCAVDQPSLRASGSVVEDFVYPWIDVLRLFLSREEIPADLFETVMRLSDPEVTRFTPEDFMLLVSYPPIEMFYYLLRGDSGKFNDSLAGAIISHRNYWSTPELADCPDGFIALGPLAIAILARKVGMDINVESDYLPANLLNGTWTAGNR